MLRGMAQRLSWEGPARDYLDLYDDALASPQPLTVQEE
jgi:hypothetical protein